MTEKIPDTELNDLAVRAKTSEEEFGLLLVKLRPTLNRFVDRYFRDWHTYVEHEEIQQWAYIELWNAVRTYEPNGMPFSSSWKWVVTKHIKGRLRRLIYGRSKEHNRTAIRFDFADGDENGEDRSTRYGVRVRVPTAQSAESIFLHTDAQKKLHDQLIETMSTLTDLEKCCTKMVYFEEQSYADAQELLGLHSRKSVDNALARVKKKISRNNELRSMYQELRAL